MTEIGIFQIVLYIFVLLLIVSPTGAYIAKVFNRQPVLLDHLLRPVERFIYRTSGINPQNEMTWITYLSAMLVFNLLGMLLVYLILRLQFYLPLNPRQFSGVTPDLAFNTAASFVTNTNWQAYSGESTMSYLVQMLALTVQNFLSAATGLSLLIALIRGISRNESHVLGNFWVDTIRGTLYILLPLAFLLSLLLISQGVIQNFHDYQTATLIQPQAQQRILTDSAGQPLLDSQGNAQVEKKNITEQIIPMGPVASQVAIKQLGSNGGGFFNANAAHPFENPTPLTNFLEMLAILFLPAALCITFGRMVNDKRQGWAILFAMFFILIPMIFITVWQEQQGNPIFAQTGINMVANPTSYPAGNMEGKETRFGIFNSAIWATVTTASSNGSVNSTLDSFTPLGGMVPLWMMHLGESVFGGVGSGLYVMLIFIIIAVFIAGLMVGRTPEYLGKKIEPYEMKMAVFAVLVMPMMVLIFTAAATILPAGVQAVTNPGAHGFSEILYAFTSMTNNNGSSYAGLNANSMFFNTLGGIAILIGRYWSAISALAIAGSLARKKIIPTSEGTLPTHTFIFIFILISVIILLGALSFFPALALGPIVEHLILWGQYAS